MGVTHATVHRRRKVLGLPANRAPKKTWQDAYRKGCRTLGVNSLAEHRWDLEKGRYYWEKQEKRA